MAALVHPPPEVIRLEDVLYALGDPVRLAIVRKLADAGELSCAAAAGPGVPKSTTSHHFKTLRDAGLVVTRKDGVCYRNRLRRDEVEARFPGLLDAVLAAAAEAASGLK